MTIIYTLAIETHEGITTRVIESTDAIEVGQVVTVFGQDSDGMLFKQTGAVVEVLEEESNA